MLKIDWRRKGKKIEDKRQNEIKKRKNYIKEYYEIQFVHLPQSAQGIISFWGN